jgi:hypothetical protein
MLPLTPKPANTDALLPAYAPPFAFPVHALHFHAPSVSSCDGQSPPTARASTVSGGICLSSLSALPAPSARMGIMHSYFGSPGSTPLYGPGQLHEPAGQYWP